MTTIGRDTRITWLGHGTFYVRTPEGRQLLIDPWVDGNPAMPGPWKAQLREGLDAILITHAHFDHIGDLLSLAGATPAQIVCQYDLTSWLAEQGIAQERLLGFNIGGSVDTAGVRATMTVAQHSSNVSPSMALGTAVGYVLRMSNGFCIYHTGDTGVTSDMQIVGELYQPDLTILPIGDHFTMDPRQAAYALKLIRSRYAIPGHWGTFPILTGTPEALKQHCLAFGLDVEVIALQPGESAE